MRLSEVQKNKLLTELSFRSSRSSGPGGQHVNKVNTKVELRFSLSDSHIFTATEKQLIGQKLAGRINLNEEIILVSDAERSQLANKEEVLRRFFSILEYALTPVKKRIKTKPTFASKKKRMENKKKLASKKQLRKKPEQ